MSTDSIDRSAPPAYDSRDSALQYVAFDLLESGFDADEQRELLDPIEEEMRRWLGESLHDGMRRAFITGPSEGAEYAIEHLIDRMEFDEVPNEYRDEIEREVTHRLREKKDHLEMDYADLIDIALRRAEEDPEDELVNWGPVV